MADETYHPDQHHPPPEGNVAVAVYHFDSAPTGTAIEGSIGIDDSTGDFYEYSNGSWALLFSGSGSVSGAPVATSGDPNGVLTAAIRTLAWDNSAKVFYINRDGATSWQELVAAP